MRHRLVFICIFFLFKNFFAEKYWITFTDKKNVSFDPYSYFDARTIAQRIAMNIPVNDSTDYPVNSEYLNKISSSVQFMSWSSRWLNGVAVYASPQEINEVKNFPFVFSVEEMNAEAELSS